MAAGPIFNAMVDLERINQSGTFERIVQLSGATPAAVVAALKANPTLVDLAKNNARIKLDQTAGFEAGVTVAATAWNGA